MGQVVLLASPAVWEHGHGPNHPLKPIRLQRTNELLEEYGAFQTLRDRSPRWLVVGGGEYNKDVVPRAWTLAFGVMAGQRFPETLPPQYRQRYGGGGLHNREQMRVRSAQVKGDVNAVITVVKEQPALSDAFRQ